MASSRKGEEITILDVRRLVYYCDYFVIANGTNRRQVRAIADSVLETVKAKTSLRAAGVEGIEASRWVLIDFGSVVVHVFDEALRSFYDLDGLWADAPRVEIVPPAQEELAGAAPSPS